MVVQKAKECLKQVAGYAQESKEIMSYQPKKFFLNQIKKNHTTVNIS